MRHEQFWLAAGAGHCGSMWLAAVFDSQPGWVGFHELRTKTLQTSWESASQLSPSHGPYWSRIKEELKTRSVLDSNSWAPFEIPLIRSIEPVDRVIYLVRNGIQQLHSLKTESPVWSQMNPESYAYSHWLKDWYDLCDMPVAFEDLSMFERLCMLIRASAYAPVYLVTKGVNAVAYRMEDLTTNPRVLGQLIPYSPEALMDWQRRDVNRKVAGDRSPQHLWKQWSNEERAAFMKWCAPMMKAYGYALPESMPQASSD